MPRLHRGWNRGRIGDDRVRLGRLCVCEVYLPLLSLALGCSVVAGACGGNNKSSGWQSSGGTSDSGTSDSSSSGELLGSLGGDGASPKRDLPAGPDDVRGRRQSPSSYIGCDYWPTVTANNVWSIFDYAVVVANGRDDAANDHGHGPRRHEPDGDRRRPNGLTKIYLPWVSALKGAGRRHLRRPIAALGQRRSQTRAARTTSSRSMPVTVYQFNALEYVGMGGPPSKDWSSCPGRRMACAEHGEAVGCYSFSNDASLLLPSTAMTGNYRVIGHGGVDACADGRRLRGHHRDGGQHDRDDDGVDARQHPRRRRRRGDRRGRHAHAHDERGRRRGARGRRDDAARPQRLAHHARTTRSRSSPACRASTSPTRRRACDHVEESILPRGDARQGLRRGAADGPARERRGSHRPHLRRRSTARPSPTPRHAGDCPTTINAGAGRRLRHRHRRTSRSRAPTRSAVAMFSHGASVVDPSTQAPNQQGDPDRDAWLSPVEQYRTEYVFLAPTDYTNNYVDVIAPTGHGGHPRRDARAGTADRGRLDGLTASCASSSATAAPARTRSSATNPVGIQVMGYGSYTSYMYPGGLDLQHISCRRPRTDRPEGRPPPPPREAWR